MVFRLQLKGKTLNNYVFKTLRASEESHCRIQCYMNDQCLSCNYISDGLTCELSESDHVMHPEYLVARPGSVYLAAEVSFFLSLYDLQSKDENVFHGLLVNPSRLA